MDHLNSPAIGLITSKDWTLDYLLAAGKRFRGVDTISAKSEAPEQIASIVKDYEQRNVPLVVQDFHHHPNWPEFFTPQWLESHYGSQPVEVRNVHGERLDRESTVAELISSLRRAPPFAYQGEHERLYGKDMSCPSEWKNWIETSGVLPHAVIPGATGDILPETVETLMSYLGISDTFTPLHKDPCASYGQNIMCHTEDEGHSFWFMTNPSDCGIVSEHFRKLGHELDWEDHVATLEELANAPFDVYVCEQRLGDLILIPPRSFHQVINAGGITIKTSWSRMSIRSLEIALYHELPIYRRVCRPETYRVKRTIYDTLMQRAAALETLVNDTPDPTHASVNPLCKEVARLIDLLDDVLEQEYSTQHRRLRQVSNGFTPGGNERACGFCGADIFLSFFQCDSCSPRDGSGGPVCLCPTCVVEGRTCKCKSMEPVQSGSFRDLLGNRNHAMVKLQAVYKAGFYEEDPEVLSDQHLIDSVKTTFQAASVLLGKRREILNSQKTTRTCTLTRKGTKSHVVDGWAIVMCGGCHSGKCFTHILEAGIHSSEALMVVELDKKGGGWHSIHTNRQKRYEEDVVPRLIWATKKGDKTEIEERLVYFARTFQTPRPLSEWVSLGFYDKELPDLEDVDQLDPGSVVGSEKVNSQITKDSSVHRLNSDSPAVSTTTDAPSRKRKRSSRPSSSKSGLDPPSQPPMDDRGREPSLRPTRSYQKWKMDCVLITTLPPVLRKKTAPPKSSENKGDHSQTKTKKRGRGRKRGKQPAAASTARASALSASRSLAREPAHSRSHSVSSLRPPLFEPDMSPSAKPDFDTIEVEDPVKVESEADDEVYVPFVSHLRQRVESESPTSAVDLPPPSSSAPSPSDEKPSYYTVVATKPRKSGSGIRFAPNQRQIAKTPAAIYSQPRVHQPVAGPSHSTRIGPPKHRLPDRSSGPKLRPAAELPPPRPPPPVPGLAALETKMNSFADENQKLRDELATAKSELAATRTELTAALTRVDTVGRDLHGLETLETQLEEVKGDYERLSNLLSSENLFSSERFRANIQAEVKSSFGYYWPSAKSDMKNQLWKELPSAVKGHVEKEVGKVSGEVEQIKSELVALRQRSTVGGSVQNGDPGAAELKQAIERLEKKQEELQAMISKVERDQEFERTRRGSASSVPRLTQNNTGNVHPPHSPAKSPSPRPDNPHQDPRRRGAQTPPAASDRNSYPFQQGSDDEADNLSQAGPTQEPYHNAVLSLPSPIFLPNPTSSLHSGSVPSHSAPIRTSLQRSHPSISAPWSPTLSQPNHGAHPSHVIQLGANNSTIVNNPVLPVAADFTPRPQRSLPTRPAHMPRSESTPSISARLPAGVHNDRIALHAAHNQFSPAAASARPPPRATFDDSQMHSPECAVERSQSLPISLSETDATVLPQDGHIPPPSPPTLDATATSITPGPLHPRSSVIPFDSSYQHTPAEIRKNPILLGSNQREQGKAAQKRKASEALPPPDPPNPPKIQKVERRESGDGNDTDDSGAAPAQGGLQKQRTKPASQPGPLNSHSGKSVAEGKDNREDGEVGEGGEVEDGEVYGYGGREPGEQPDYHLAHPHGVEYAWDQSGAMDDLHDLW